tara:strand:- start:574 stop:837 length:264 start_codon:yes stop_codon:yes gene_type:complete
MKDTLSNMIYCALIISAIAAVFSVPAILIALFAGVLSWISGWSFGWIFSIGITVTFMAAASVLNSLYMEMQNYKLDLNFDEDEEDLL